MKVPVAVQLEHVAEASLGHFENSVLDGFEFVLDLWVVFCGVIQRAKHFQSLSFLALENEPTQIVSLCPTFWTMPPNLTIAEIPVVSE